jgi:hypothetical protein
VFAQRPLQASCRCGCRSGWQRRPRQCSCSRIFASGLARLDWGSLARFHVHDDGLHLWQSAVDRPRHDTAEALRALMASATPTTSAGGARYRIASGRSGAFKTAIAAQTRR